MSDLAPDSRNDIAGGRAATGGCGPRVVFAWPDFEPEDLFAGLTGSRLALAETLAARGAEVVMAWAGRSGGAGETRLREWVAGRGTGAITVEAVPVACRLNHPWRLRWERAFDFRQWLRAFALRHPVAVVNVPDTGGVAYYALLAKRGGVDFEGVRFVVEASGPLRRLRALGHLAIDNLQDLYQDFLERRCIEMADALIAPDPVIPDWLASHGWAMPAQVAVAEPVSDASVAVAPAGRVSRIVFIAPLSMGGQLPRVCRTLGQDSVKDRLRDVEIVFWGPSEGVRDKAAMAHIEASAASWPFRWRVEGDLSARAAERLFGDGAGVAIFPTGRSMGWLPYQWCRDSGVACVEPVGLGAQSRRMHMDAADLRRLEEIPDPEAIGRALHAALDGTTNTQGTPPSPGGGRVEARVKLMLEPPTPARAQAMSTAEAPLVSVCIVTRNRARLLPQALASIEAQDYPAIEVVLVDDGSTMKGALAILDDLEPRFRQKGWRMFRQEERTFHAAARNRAVREARGEWVMLFDDDCVSEPHQIRTMLAFATNIGADIVTCPRHVFIGDHRPATGDRSGSVWVPLGAVPAAGLFENCLGDTNLLIRRRVFLELEGLRTDFGVPSADREFLIRAATAGL
ncbi:MAG TPA: glycosyltransferase [Verrucomicrobiae bacterium]|nr:glycosyltransferase [Verrucomicrobiae bacterium]